MQGTKSFLYLDEYKMYSISSQLFGGLTEYLIDYKETTSEEEESQRGPLASGRMMANILKSESGTQEKKYLHDYSYSLFERHLKDNESVHCVSGDNVTEAIQCTDDIRFVEVRGNVAFNDMTAIKDTIARFNEIGEALTYVTGYKQLAEVRQQLTTLINSKSDRNEKAKLRQQLRALGNIDNLAKEKGLHQDPDFLKKIGLLLDFGFQDQFEVQLTIGKYTFSANLKREYLRENEHLLVRKYSRFPAKQFVLFGTIAQGLSKPVDSEVNELNSEIDEEKDPQHLKNAILRIVEALATVEDTFFGKLPNEVIVDPIALYCQI